MTGAAVKLSDTKLKKQAKRELHACDDGALVGDDTIKRTVNLFTTTVNHCMEFKLRVVLVTLSVCPMVV